MTTISITTSQNIALDYELGSVGDRLVAGIIDTAIIAGYIVILGIMLSLAGASSTHNGAWAILLAYFPVVFYSLYSELLFNGQTVGKKVMGIKVISLDGDRPTLGQYLIRWLFRIIDIWLMSFVLAIILVAATDRRQRLGDMVAGTVVVKTKSKIQLSQTLFMPVAETGYTVTYPEVIRLRDIDIQLIKEVLTSAQKTGNTLMALQAMRKIGEITGIKSKHEPIPFLYAVLSDYNHLTSKL